MDDRAAWARRRAQGLYEQARWHGACRVLTWALREAPDDPWLLSLLGRTLWWLDLLQEARGAREGAYRAFRERGEHAAAAYEAMWLAREHVFASGAAAVAEGWFAVAARELEAGDDDVARCWLDALRLSIGLQEGDSLETAEAVLAAARRTGDADLEAFAQSHVGLGLVRSARVEAGLRTLDTAGAAALAGTVQDRYVASEILCSVLFGCDAAGDYRRALEWSAAADEIGRRRGGTFLAAVCRVTRASVLTAAGDWAAAERDLLDAKRLFESSHYALRIPAVARLADLRAREGRFEEADALLAGIEHHQAALPARARMALMRGEAAGAAELLAAAIGDDPGIYDAPALALLVDCLVAAGRPGEAAGWADALVRLGEAGGAGEIRVLGLRAKAAAVGGSDPDLAAKLLREALAAAWQHERSPSLPAIHLQLARLLVESDAELAAAHARSALAGFAALGAARDRDAAAELLRRLGRPTRLAGSAADPLSAREQEVLDLVRLGLSNPEIAARLFISRKTVERHITAILGKLGLRNRAEAAVHAQQLRSEK